MPVLCEAISVVVRRDAIDKYFKGGWIKFVDHVPNSTMCTDGELVRVGFMTPNSVQDYIEFLETNGLQFQTKKKVFKIFGGGRDKNDIVVVDQHQGATLPCDWMEFGKFRFGEEKLEVSMCWLFEGERLGVGVHMRSNNMDLSCPQGWTPEHANNLKFADFESLDDQYQFLRSENDLDVFWDNQTEKEVFIVRPLER